jgi:hypothetical protein
MSFPASFQYLLAVFFFEQPTLILFATYCMVPSRRASNEKKEDILMQRIFLNATVYQTIVLCIRVSSHLMDDRVILFL